MDGSDQTSDYLERAKRGEHPEDTAGVAPPVATPAAERPVRDAWWARGLALGLVFATGGGIVWTLLSSSEDAFVYSEMVDDVMSDPARHAGRTLRVEGQLQNGSVLFREDPCEWRFKLEREGREMPVEFAQCVVPDTFRDGMGISVTVEGRLREDGTFLASQVIPKCPSRYEMDQRQQAGESMPHAPSPETSSAATPRPPS